MGASGDFGDRVFRLLRWIDYRFVFFAGARPDNTGVRYLFYTCRFFCNVACAYKNRGVQEDREEEKTGPDSADRACLCRFVFCDLDVFMIHKRKDGSGIM